MKAIYQDIPKPNIKSEIEMGHYHMFTKECVDCTKVTIKKHYWKKYCGSSCFEYNVCSKCYGWSCEVCCYEYFCQICEDEGIYCERCFVTFQQ